MAPEMLPPEPELEPEGGAMGDDELVSILDEHETRAIGYYTSEIASDQENALHRYYRRPYGDEREGRSKVVDGTVSVVVDNAVAAILKPFVAAEDTVEFKPRGPEDVEQAKQATEFVNYVFQTECNGFLVLHDWVKEALLLKLGVVKIYWEDRSRDVPEELTNLDDQQALMLQQEGVEIYGPDERGFYSATVSRRHEDGSPRIENVPVEEYRLSPYARPGTTPPYEAHIRALPRSELIEMGFPVDVVMSLSKWSEGADGDGRAQARHQDEEMGANRLDMPGDASREKVKVNEEYVLVDFDGDNVSELRKIIRVGEVILYNEPVDESCFATLCPVPMPHKVIGQSLADLVMDEQRIATVVLRQTLDNLYLANNPKLQVPDSAERDDGATIEALLDPAPGAPVPVKQATIVPLEIPFVADKSFPMLEYVHRQVEARTGIRRDGNGLDRDSLNTGGQITATQASQIEDKENERVEMIARIFAETGIKRLFRLLLKLLVDHQPRAKMIRLRNEWVEIDPRSWNADMDLSIAVGLGVGNKQDRLMEAQTVLTTMERVAMSPFKTLLNQEKAYNALKRLFTAAGVKNVDDYLVEPPRDEQGNVVEAEAQPDPEAMAAQAEAQMREQEMRHKQQMAEVDRSIRAQEAQQKLDDLRAEKEFKLTMEAQERAARLDMDRQRIDDEYDLALMRQEREEALAERKMAMNERQAEHKMSEARPGGDLDK